MKTAGYFSSILALLVIAAIALPVPVAASGNGQHSVPGFTWIGQENTTEYCVEAVAQMITRYYHDRNPAAVPTVWSQAEIMKKIARNFPRNEVEKYYSRPNSDVGLGAVLSDYENGKPDWDNVVMKEIDANRPFKIGITNPFYHAVAVAGYKVENGVKYLRIYNPDPSRPGPYWENYDDLYITNYITIAGIRGIDS